MPRRWNRFLRAEDLVWLALFAAMAAFGPARHASAVILLSCLAVFQVIEPKDSAARHAARDHCRHFVKLALGYLLIGDTEAINSSYYWILLLPVVSAATSLGLLGTVFFTYILACLSYLSFLLFIDWSPHQFIPPEEIGELSLRFLFLVLVGFLTCTLAEANRAAARRYQAVAETRPPIAACGRPRPLSALVRSGWRRWTTFRRAGARTPQPARDHQGFGGSAAETSVGKAKRP